MAIPNFEILNAVRMSSRDLFLPGQESELASVANEHQLDHLMNQGAIRHTDGRPQPDFDTVRFGPVSPDFLRILNAKVPVRMTDDERYAAAQTHFAEVQASGAPCDCSRCQRQAGK